MGVESPSSSHCAIDTPYHKLYVKFSKCEFWIESVTFLGHVMSYEGIRVNLAKVEMILGCPRPTSVTKGSEFY